MEYDPQEEQRIRELEALESMSRDEATPEQLKLVNPDPIQEEATAGVQQPTGQQPSEATPVQAAQQQVTQQAENPNSDIGPDGYYKKPTLGEFTEGMGYDNTQIRETLSAPGTGLADFAVDSVNMIAGWLGFDKPIPKIPKFEGELAQSGREISSLVLPMLAGNAAAVRGIGAIPAVKNSAALQATVPRVIGTKLAETGVGAGVGYISSTSEEANVSGTLKSTYPRAFGWIPDFVATNDNDSPDDKRRKNVVEGVLFDSTLGIIESGFALTRKLNANSQSMNWVPANEKGEAYFDKNLPRSTPEEAKEYFIDAHLEDFIEANPKATDAEMMAKMKSLSREWDNFPSERKRIIRAVSNQNSPQASIFGIENGQSQAMDELGEYNMFKRGGDLNFDEPVFGVHDLYGYRESGIRQVDDLGVVSASVDAARISGNAGTMYGRLASMLSDGAMKYTIDTGAYDDISRGLADELTAAGEYGYKTNDGKFIPFQKIQEAGDVLATKLWNTTPEEMSEVLEPFMGKVTKAGSRALNTEGAKAVESVIKRYQQQMLEPDLLRAQGLLSTSLAGQAADTAMGVRLMDGTEAMSRGSEQVLDRLEYLMNLKNQTDFTKANTIQLGNLWKQLNTWGPNATVNKNARAALRQWEATRAAGEESLAQLRQQTALTISTMREIGRQQPELMRPFLFAYEMSDGALNTMTSLNRYYNNTTGVWKKAFVDAAPDVPSVYNRAWWSNVYNNTLAALGTPIKAVSSGGVLLLERPIATGVGALMHRDMETLRRGWFMYSGALDTLTNGLDYMKKVWSKAGTDPYMQGVREGFNTQDQKQLAIMKSIADGKAAQGDLGPQVMVGQIEEMLDMANHPWLRFGSRSMQAFDGFVQAVVGNWEARGRAWSSLTENGTVPMTRDKMREMSKRVYADMFDESGLITDSAVKYASGEISFNLDSGWNDGITTMLETLPALKPFMMFTKTPLTAAAFTASSNPLGAFFNQLNKFELPFEKMEGAKVERLLQERGVTFDASTVKSEYDTIRAELKGRKAIGALAVGSAVGMFMNDRLTGNGLYDAQAQAARRDQGWKPRSYKGWDGKWYSYDNLGAISDYIALTADIMDNGLDFDAFGKGTLRNQEVGESLRALGFVVSAALTDRTYLANLEPLMDVLRGDPGAINRWAGGFLPSATIPGANAVGEFGRLLDPGLKIVENNMISIASNRTPLKAAMPSRYDYIDGGIVNQPTDFFTRLWNNYTPWKVTGAISPEKQFLMDVGFDARPSVKTDGKGAVYSADEQSELLSLVGQRGYFKKAVAEIMKTSDAETFRREFKKAQNQGLSPDPKTFDGLHKSLQDALTEAMSLARLELTSVSDVQLRGYKSRLVDKKLRKGDVEGASEINNLKKFGNN